MAMKILIDADGCPVVDLTLQAAAEHGLEAILFCDTSHEFKGKNARVVTVDKGSDSADFALIRQVKPGDIVVTQDYGLAAMVLAKRGYPITQNGTFFAYHGLGRFFKDIECYGILWHGFLQ